MGVTAPEGFVAASAAAGIKANGAADVAIVATADGRPVPAAAVFTQNEVVAAPVEISRAHLASSGGHAAAVVLTAGNANCLTGPVGLEAARRLCRVAAEGIGCDVAEVLVCQTGLIGVPFPIEAVEPVLAKTVAARAPGAAAGSGAAEAIMTTDTVRKEVVIRGEGFTVGAMAKGAAMVAPNMATMLAVLTTDAVIDPTVLDQLLRRAVDRSFNRLVIDGCTSTNDTVAVLASGKAAVADAGALESAMTEACGQLAEAMAADAEGASKVVHIAVTGARSDADAERGARQIAKSLLVKCSLNGEDPYWGRVLSELGAAGIGVVADRVVISYGGIPVCGGGAGIRHDAQAVAAHMAGSNIELHAELGLGQGSCIITSTDLGHGYIEENRRTS